jgi:energy-coupling factor transporter ATP-binding protein EcfA2
MEQEVTNMARPNEIKIPKSDGSTGRDKAGSFETLSDLESLVIVGANGSGKSRFGYAIEKANRNQCRIQRIAAQRALEVPESVTPTVTESALNEWYYGRKDGTNEDQRDQLRWKQKPVTGLLNDYERLMRLVFAKTHDRNHEFTRSHLDGSPLDKPPESSSDVVERVWSKVFPHRSLVFNSGKIMASDKGREYNAAEMSDGERVALYLMANAFVSPSNSVLIIDEPEIHLHRSIRDTLFDYIEAERADCLFIYLTHDVDFATTRPVSKKIWLKEFTGNGWCWEELEEAEGLPVALVAELLGSRRPVLFVEGDNDSLDYLIYSAVYPGRYVVSVGGCERVIHFTKALNAAPQLHHLSATGIVDRDRRSTDEVHTLGEKGIHVLDVAEVENLILTPGVLKEVSEKLGFGEDKVSETQGLVFDRLEAVQEQQISERAIYYSRKQLLESFDEKAGPTSRLGEVLRSLSSEIETEKIINEARCDIVSAIEKKDYELALRVFNAKGLSSHVAQSVFSLGKVGKEDGLTNFVRRHLHSNKESKIVDALSACLPALEGKAVPGNA